MRLRAGKMTTSIPPMSYNYAFGGSSDQSPPAHHAHAAPHPHHVAYGTMHETPNAGFAGSGRREMAAHEMQMQHQSAYVQPHYQQQYQHPQYPQQYQQQYQQQNPPQSIYPEPSTPERAHVMHRHAQSPCSIAPSTPESTITTSSHTTDLSDSDADVEAMVDAAMEESGILTIGFLPDDHFGLDAELMQEMKELFTSPRASSSNSSGTSEWSQLYHDSPRAKTSTTLQSYPVEHLGSIPNSPMDINGVDWEVPTSPVSFSTKSPTANASPFTPSGDGWQVQPGNPSNGELGEDTDMDDEVDPYPEAAMVELQMLMREIKFLEAQRDFLDYKASVTPPTEQSLSSALIQRRDAIKEKQKLMEARMIQEMLSNAINHQFENLKYVQQQLLESPLTHYRNTLMTPMESYLHLTRNPRERRKALVSIRGEKLDTARRFIDFQSRNIDVERDFFFLDSFEKFGKFYTVDFSISKLEDTTVDDVAFVFYFHFVYTKDRISKILNSVENREYFDGVDWEFLHGRFVDRVNLLRRRRNGKSFVVQESNTVFYAKKIGDAFVMTCDSIDKDELHPYRSTGRIRQDMIFGVVVEPYVDSQGKESVLLKRFSFYRHHFNNIEPTPELLQAISTKIILWGQAVRMCVSSREKDRLPIPLSRKPLKRAGAPMVLTNW